MWPTKFNLEVGRQMQSGKLLICDGKKMRRVCDRSLFRGLEDRRTSSRSPISNRSSRPNRTAQTNAARTRPRTKRTVLSKTSLKSASTTQRSPLAKTAVAFLGAMHLTPSAIWFTGWHRLTTAAKVWKTERPTNQVKTLSKQAVGQRGTNESCVMGRP